MINGGSLIEQCKYIVYVVYHSMRARPVGSELRFHKPEGQVFEHEECKVEEIDEQRIEFYPTEWPSDMTIALYAFLFVQTIVILRGQM
jgi:hypothetical protein